MKYSDKKISSSNDVKNYHLKERKECLKNRQQQFKDNQEVVSYLRDLYKY
ncbi:MAG: hypothetical protein HXX81_05595 [Campylobacterales bacterium]|nr:hypothetical protein [Campylobacterales bacterium]